MDSQPPCHLTIEDHAALEALLDRALEPFGDHAALLRRKLAGARIWSAQTIAPTVVTLDSRVSYRIDGRQLETRIVSLRASDGAVGATLSAMTLQGLAMIGRAAGETFDLVSGDRVRRLTVFNVHYQPEAAAREAVARSAARGVRAHLRLVHSADDFSGARWRRPAGDDDDPGPSAA